MKVSEIMTKQVISVAPDTKVGVIAGLLVDHGISGVPVVDSAGKVVGIVTDSDLIVRSATLHFPRFLQILDARIYLEGPKHFEEELRRMLGVTAADLMSSPALVVDPDDDIERAATIMMDKEIHALPVVKNGKLVGILSQRDLVQMIADEEKEG